jgi:DNA-directed RNA polymerase specialized sigma subunit
MYQVEQPTSGETDLRLDELTQAVYALRAEQAKQSNTLRVILGVLQRVVTHSKFPQTLTVSETAEVLGVSESWIRQNPGRLPRPVLDNPKRYSTMQIVEMASGGER